MCLVALELQTMIKQGCLKLTITVMIMSNSQDNWKSPETQLGQLFAEVLTWGEPVSLARGVNQPRLVDDEMKQILLDTIELHPTFTPLQLKFEMQSQLPHKSHVSPTTIARCLVGNLIVTIRLEALLMNETATLQMTGGTSMRHG